MAVPALPRAGGGLLPKGGIGGGARQHLCRGRRAVGLSGGEHHYSFLTSAKKAITLQFYRLYRLSSTAIATKIGVLH
jgi:hypothetical protein